jgi:hypothetical protein
MLKHSLSKQEEIDRAQETLLKGLCFISRVPLNNEPYELVWHVSANTYVFVHKKYVQDRYDLLKNS